MTVCVEDIITQYESGKTYKEIADTLGIGESTVRKYLTECRIANTLGPSTSLRRKNIYALKQERRKAISIPDDLALNLYRDHTLYEISRMYNILQEKLKEQLENLGINFHPDFYESIVPAVCNKKAYIYIKDKVLPYGPDLIRNTDYLLNTVLSQKERNVLTAIYPKRKTLKTAAKELGYSDSGIGSARDKILKELRKPENFIYFTMTFEDAQKILEAERMRKAETDVYDSLLPIKKYVSVRTYHLLLRAGFHNIDEIKEDPQRIIYFRGAGKCTIAEVMNALTILQKQEAG